MVLPIRSPFRRFFTASALAYTEYGDLLVSELKRTCIIPKTHSVNDVDMPEVNAQLKQLVKTDHLSNARTMFDKMPY